MSYNLHLEATVLASLHTKGHYEIRTVTEKFDLRQTPTKTTERILSYEGNSARLERYLEWLRSLYPEETVEIPYLAQDDNPELLFTEEGEKVLYYETVESDRVEHERLLMNWLNDHSGWLIQWYGM